jgi:hypothetical protein
MPISGSPLPVQKLPIHPKRQLAIALRAPFKAVDLSPIPTSNPLLQQLVLVIAIVKTVFRSLIVWFYIQ